MPNNAELKTITLPHKVKPKSEAEFPVKGSKLLLKISLN